MRLRMANSSYSLRGRGKSEGRVEHAVLEDSSLMESEERTRQPLEVEKIRLDKWTVASPEDLKRAYVISSKKPHNRISPWHDIKLREDFATQVKMVVEIPKGTRAKMEMQKWAPGNPIMQDTTSSGRPRFYKYGATFFNYGFLPQTLEEDGDPLDIVELCEDQVGVGTRMEVALVGVIKLIDQGERDYKLMAVSSKCRDKLSIQDTKSLEEHFPGVTDRLLDWMENYKVAEGKKRNTFDEPRLGTAEDAWKILIAADERYKSAAQDVRFCENNGCYPSGENATSSFDSPPGPPTGSFSAQNGEVGDITPTRDNTNDKISVATFLKTAIAALVEAGDTVFAFYFRRMTAGDVTTKDKTTDGVNLPVSRADIFSSDLILDRLHKTFSRLTIISEEKASSTGSMSTPSRIPVNGSEVNGLDARPTSRKTVLTNVERLTTAAEGKLPAQTLSVRSGASSIIVDPLDGTKEFLEGDGNYTTLMSCLIENGIPIAGVIYAPLLKEIVWGMRGYGFFDGKTFHRVEGTMRRRRNVVDPVAIYHNKNNAKSQDAKNRTSSFTKKKDMLAVVSRSHSIGSEELAAAVGASNITRIPGAGYKGLALLGLVHAAADKKPQIYAHAGNIRDWDLCAVEAVLRAAGGNVRFLGNHTTAETYSYGHGDFTIRGGFVAEAPSKKG